MIKQPLWAKDSIPTTTGWRTADGKELLKSQRFTSDEVAEWMNTYKTPATIVEDVIEPVAEVFEDDKPEETTDKPEVLTEAPIVDTPLDKMTDNEKANVLTDTKPKPKGKKSWLKKLTSKK